MHQQIVIQSNYSNHQPVNFSDLRRLVHSGIATIQCPDLIELPTSELNFFLLLLKQQQSKKSLND